jgi:SAM-dependent methyltransferase
MTFPRCRFRGAALALALCSICAIGTSPARADDAGAGAGYREGAASADGIGKFYAGREIAHVMGYEGASWLERPSRDAEERPDLLVAELNLTPGMTVADIGAGSGYLSRRLAPRVKPGRVYAVDVQAPMVVLLDALSKQPGFENIEAHRGSDTDVGLKPQSLDLAVLVDVYHELAFPIEVMDSIVRALKPGGRVVLVEYRGEDPAIPIKALHKMSEQQVRREMSRFPLIWERTSERLPIQHMVIFRKKA